MVHIDSMLAVAAGLLASTMTPCLIQLVFFYFAAVSGASVSEAWEGGLSDEELRKYKIKLMKLSGAFALGVLIVFTASGAIVGFLGKEVRNVPLWSGNAVWAQRLAGAGFIVMGVWMGNATRAPVVCKIPVPSLRRKPQDLGFVGMMALGFLFMFGCATCFSGAIFAALLIYIGATTAPLQGALIMFFFGLGVVIPLLVASALLTKVYPYMVKMENAAKYMGLASSLFIIGFGVVALLGQFHTLSDIIWNTFLQ